MTRKPVVIVEVSGGVAEETLCLAGTGVPEVYVWDWDNIKEDGGEDCVPDIPDWVYKAYHRKHGEHLRHVIALQDNE